MQRQADVFSMAIVKEFIGYMGAGYGQSNQEKEIEDLRKQVDMLKKAQESSSSQLLEKKDKTLKKLAQKNKQLENEVSKLRNKDGAPSEDSVKVQVHAKINQQKSSCVKAGSSSKSGASDKTAPAKKLTGLSGNSSAEPGNSHAKKWSQPMNNIFGEMGPSSNRPNVVNQPNNLMNIKNYGPTQNKNNADWKKSGNKCEESAGFSGKEKRETKVQGKGANMGKGKGNSNGGGYKGNSNNLANCPGPKNYQPPSKSQQDGKKNPPKPSRGNEQDNVIQVKVSGAGKSKVCVVVQNK